MWQASLDFPSKVEPLLGIFGQAGYEGVQTDPDGTIWVIEDTGGTKGKTNAHARQPNSFVFRFVPKDKTDLTKGGKLQALQIVASNGQPITFHKDDVDGDIMSEGMKELHSYGVTLKTAWVVLHDTDTDGTEPFDANALAKEKQATPLKRRRTAFRPGTGFKEFVFDETGDTDTRTEAGSEYGGFSAVLKLVQADPAADKGTISLIYRGDAEHTALDNIAFWSADKVVVVEDASDAVHSQRKAFNSAYVLDLTADYSKADVEPMRLFAIGRDPLATILPRSAAPAPKASRTTATTRSPASTSPTATRPKRACSGPRCRRRSAMAGGFSTRSSTARTRPGRSSLRPRQRRTEVSARQALVPAPAGPGNARSTETAYLLVRPLIAAALLLLE